MASAAPVSHPSSLLAANTAPARRVPWTHAKAIALGALTVGTLDITDAIVYWWFRADAPPMRILQSVAAGLLGRDAARAGGLPTALLGLFLHFFIATSVVIVYNLASRRLPVLTQHPVICGIAYGLCVYLVMYYVVMPLSAIHSGVPHSPLPVLANNLLIHILGIGIPSALFAARAAEVSGRP